MVMCLDGESFYCHVWRIKTVKSFYIRCENFLNAMLDVKKLKHIYCSVVNNVIATCF